MPIWLPLVGRELSWGAAVATLHIGGGRAIIVMGKNEGRSVGEVMAYVQLRLDALLAQCVIACCVVVSGDQPIQSRSSLPSLLPWPLR